jgi:hypothetical protein
MLSLAKSLRCYFVWWSLITTLCTLIESGMLGDVLRAVTSASTENNKSKIDCFQNKYITTYERYYVTCSGANIISNSEIPSAAMLMLLMMGKLKLQKWDTVHSKFH